MPSTHTFSLPAVAVEAIGAQLPSFRQKIAACPDELWDIVREPGGDYVIRCTADAATVIAKLLQGVGRSPLASTEKVLSCLESASLIGVQISREQQW